jgi:DNA-binding MarR family transcriptional regulator
VARRADISLLFDLFVASQRVRRVLAEGMARSGLRPDEYAVYSLLFEKAPLTATEMAELMGMPLTTVLDYLKTMSAAGHLERAPHPSDGRALQLRLSRSGIAAQKRAHDHWDVVRLRLERGLDVPIDQVRRALQALDESAFRAATSRPTWDASERGRPTRRGTSALRGRAGASAGLRARGRSRRLSR